MQEKICAQCGLAYEAVETGEAADDVEDLESHWPDDNGMCPMCWAESEETAVFDVEKELLW
jgi:hypothetical protein